MARTKHYTFSLSILVLFFVLFCAPTAILATETLIFVGSKDTKESFHGRWLTLIYDEVFRRLGYRWEYWAFPSPRASAMSDGGEVDGEIARVPDYGSAHPNVVMVSESHFDTRIAAFAVTPGISLDGWSSLQGTSFLINYRRGTKIVEKGLERYGNAAEVYTVNSSSQGLKKLITGRTDLYIDVEHVVLDELQRLPKDKFNTSAVYNAGHMVKSSLHMFLHKKRADLAPKISAVLQKMKREGLIEHYRQTAFMIE